MATRLASVHVLAPRVGVRPSEVSDAPALSRNDIVKRLLRQHRRSQALQRLMRMRQARRAPSRLSWLRGVWEGRRENA